MRVKGIASATADNAYRNLNQGVSEFNDSVKKISTGKRINSASDDAAGLALSNKLKAKSKSLHAAKSNTNQALAFAQIASSSMENISTNIIRMRELAIQSMNGTLDYRDRHLIQKEFNELKKEIDRIGKSTNYLNNKILKGGARTIDIQVGFRKGKNNRISINVPDLAATVDALGIYRVSVATLNDAKRSLPRLDYALNDISKSRAYYGALLQQIESAAKSLTLNQEGTKSTNSKIEDSDMAQESAAKTAADIKIQASTKVLKEDMDSKKSFIGKLID